MAFDCLRHCFGLVKGVILLRSGARAPQQTKVPVRGGPVFTGLFHVLLILFTIYGIIRLVSPLFFEGSQDLPIDPEAVMQLQHPLTTPYPGSDTIVAPQLLLEQSALDMIAAYVNAAPGTEISGFGYVKKLPGSNVYYVATADDIFITEQLVTIGSAHVKGADYSLALDRAMDEERDDELRLQWHSHPSDVYFSPTDRTNIEVFGQTAEWFISLVTNRQGELRARFDSFRPVRIGVEIEVVVYRMADAAMIERARTDVAALVHQPKPLLPKRRGRKHTTAAVVVTTKQ